VYSLNAEANFCRRIAKEWLKTSQGDKCLLNLRSKSFTPQGFRDRQQCQTRDLPKAAAALLNCKTPPECLPKSRVLAQSSAPLQAHAEEQEPIAKLLDHQ
jgi:hypothetical protein